MDASRGAREQRRRCARRLSAGLMLVAACLLTASCASLGSSRGPAVLHPQSEGEFRLIVRDSRRPVLAVFTSESCISCRALGSTLEGLAADYAGRLTVVQADLAKTGGLIREYNLLKVPTAVILRNGHEVARRHGALPPLFMKPFIDDALRRRVQ